MVPSGRVANPLNATVYVRSESKGASTAQTRPATEPLKRSLSSRRNIAAMAPGGDERRLKKAKRPRHGVQPELGSRLAVRQYEGALPSRTRRRFHAVDQICIRRRPRCNDTMDRNAGPNPMPWNTTGRLGREKELSI